MIGPTKKPDPLIPRTAIDIIWKMRGDVISIQENCRHLRLLAPTDEEPASRKEDRHESLKGALLSLEKQINHLRLGIKKAVPATRKQEEDASRAPRLEEMCRKFERENIALKGQLRAMGKKLDRAQHERRALKDKTRAMEGEAQRSKASRQ